MSKRFESNLLGRTINANPPGILHLNKDLPDNAALYQVHTIYLDEGMPAVIAELTDESNVAEGGYAPDSVKVLMAHFGMLYNLHPKENDDES